MSTLPVILAGPILRKVTKSSVTVWLALSVKTRVKLDVLKSDDASDVAFSSTADPVRIGEHLYMVCVTARNATDVLGQSKIYSYNLTFPDAPGNPGLVKALGAPDASSIAYGGRKFPSFAFEPDFLRDLRIFHGSCRKPNASGPETLSLMDDFIAETEGDAVKRPHLMIMSGDQIYADEVADVLLMMLRDAADTLIAPTGPYEMLPVASNNLMPPGALAPGLRKTACDAANLTTDDRRSHLMAFDEYLMMYLFVWSDVLWPADIPDYNDLLAAYDKQWPNQKPLYVALKVGADVAEQRDGVVNTRAGLKAVRRALANIPCYMIFDDHEITDDWNMTQDFCERVYGSTLGRRIVQNGLVAYSLCQHWGNAPEQFENGEVGDALIQEFNKSLLYQTFVDEGWVRAAVGAHTAQEIKSRNPPGVFHDSTGSFRYDHTIEGVNFQVIVTDTRSWRSYPRGILSAPDLMLESQLDVQIGGSPPLNKRMLIIVVSTNMPPSPAIRQATRDLPGMNKKYIYDDLFDSWEIDRVDYARALAKISRKFDKNVDGVYAGQLVLLSGDVHSSSASHLQYSATDQQVGDTIQGRTQAELSIAQLVASALHNQGGKTLGQHMGGYRWVPDKFTAQMAAQPFEQTEGFIGYNPATTADGIPIAKYYHDTQFLGDGKDDLPYRGTKATYATRKEELFPVWETHIIKVLLPPHYRIRLDYLTAAHRSSNFVISPLTPEEKKKQGVLNTKEYMRYISQFRDGRHMIGRNNIGEFRFGPPQTSVASTIAAIYRVHFIADGGQKQWQEFEVGLEPGTNYYPMLADPS